MSASLWRRPRELDLVPSQAVVGKRGGWLAWLEFKLVRVLLWTCARLPRALRQVLVGLLARVATRLDRNHSRAAEQYITQALGPRSPQELRRAVRQAWRHLLELTLDAERFERELPAERYAAQTKVEMCPQAQAIARSGRPCVILSAHVGDWENGVALLPHLGFSPLYAISKPPKNRYLAQHAQALRQSRGIRLLPRRGAMEFVPAVLKGGGSVAMMLDQRARVKPVWAPFFGRLASCDRSAGVLLRRLKAPLVIAAVYREPKAWHYRAVFPVVIEPEELQGASGEEVATRINQELERLILACPQQYFWLHDRYRGAPSAG